VHVWSDIIPSCSLTVFLIVEIIVVSMMLYDMIAMCGYKLYISRGADIAQQVAVVIFGFWNCCCVVVIVVNGRQQHADSVSVLQQSNRFEDQIGLLLVIFY
jgi:hypothetical protein